MSRFRIRGCVLPHYLSTVEQSRECYTAVVIVQTGVFAESSRQLHKREEPYRALFLETNYPQSVYAVGTGFQLR